MDPSSILKKFSEEGLEKIEKSGLGQIVRDPIGALFNIFLILFLTLLTYKSMKWVLRKFFSNKMKAHPESSSRILTLQTFGLLSLKIFVSALGIMLILGQIGIDLGPLLATAGDVGFAIGFGSQELVKDVISGFFILLEDQIRVGDVVDLGGHSGLVEKINLRSVVLRDLSGTVHFIRNGSIAAIKNLTKDFSCHVIDIGVSYDSNIKKVIAAIKEAGDITKENFPVEVLADVEVFGVDNFGDSSINIRGRIRTLPGKQWQTKRFFNERLKEIFDRDNIEIPFPQRTLHLRREETFSPLLSDKLPPDSEN